MLENDIIKMLVRKYTKISMFLDTYFIDLTLLLIRFSLAKNFWFAGLDKYKSWYTTQFIFKNVYNIPIINHKFMAFLTTGLELLGAVLLLFGLGSRLISFLFIIVIGIIDLSYQGASEYTKLLLLMVLLSMGSGRYSLEMLFCKKSSIKS